MRILHLEDSAPDAELVADRLAREYPDCRIEHASTRAQFETALAHGNFDLIVSDYTLHDFDGLSALEIARRQCPAKPFIFLSGTIGEERAIEALRRGATDYVIKDRPSRLVPAIRNALARAAEEEQLRRTEDALLEDRERFRQITENVADLILMLERSGRCVYRNPAYNAAMGRTRESAAENPFDDVHPEDRILVDEAFRETVRTGIARRLEYRLVGRNGAIRHVEAQNTAVRDPSGSVRQVLVVARDVTERRADVERIRQQAALLDRAQDAILMRDMSDRITFWNQSAARIYGVPAAEALGRTVDELLHEDKAQADAARRATLFYGEWMGEMRQRSRQGADLIMQSRWSLVQAEDGTAAGFLLINTDVAEKKRLEAQFLRAQRTESIGILAGGIAHDINNVLVPILASADLLEPTVTDPESRRFVACIRASAQHGAELIRQLLAFARGAAGDPVELSFRSLLDEFVGFASQILPRSVSIDLVAGPELWSISGDAIQLKQVLVNLCINAVDAMPRGGHIQLRAVNEHISEAAAAALHEIKAGPHVVLSLSDNGEGMDRQVVQRIFDPFFTTKEIGKGTGLGLAAVRGIVKGHQGCIAVESEPGRGTTFRLYLPALGSAAATEPEAPPTSEVANGDGEGILLVDDEPAVREILAMLLRASGYRVRVASSGDEALASYRRHAAETGVVLTDVTMPDKDGFALASELRALRPDLPILVMSGMAGAGEYDEVARRLQVPLLPKPITRDALIAAVQHALRSTSRG